MTTRILTAIPVPFTADGDLDLPEYDTTLRTLHEHVHGVLVAGTTGEFPALDDGERVELFRRAAEVFGPDRVLAHLGHGSTRQVLRLAEASAAVGITRFALITPYYLPTDGDGVVAYFRALTEAYRSARVYPYLFPERTGMDIPVDVLRQVMRLPGVAGAKLSGGAAERLPEYAAAMYEGQEMYSGADATLPLVVELGGAGLISGVSSAFPRTFAALARAFDDGDAETARSLQQVVTRLVGLTGGNIPRLKAAIAARTGAPWACRMSLPAVDAETRTEIEKAVAQYD